MRPKELRRLFWKRHGRTFPADEIGLRDAAIMLDHLVPGETAYREMTVFLRRRCPWLPSVPREILIKAALQRRKFWDKSELGNALNLTWSDRKDCNIVTFRPAGATDADMEAHRKALRNQQGKNRRLRNRLKQGPRVSKPRRRAEAILDLLPTDDPRFYPVAGIVNRLERSKAGAFADLDRNKGSLRPAVHRAIDVGVKLGLFETNYVDGSKVADTLQIRRAGR
jgi:hypothetical protein